VELELPSLVEEEERLDYKEIKKDLLNNVLEESKEDLSTLVVKEGDDTQAGGSAQVQPFDPYGFD